jgi:hypothetical protein
MLARLPCGALPGVLVQGVKAIDNRRNRPDEITYEWGAESFSKLFLDMMIEGPVFRGSNSIVV